MAFGRRSARWSRIAFVGAFGRLLRLLPGFAALLRFGFLLGAGVGHDRWEHFLCLVVRACARARGVGRWARGRPPEAGEGVGE